MASIEPITLPIRADASHLAKVLRVLAQVCHEVNGSLQDAACDLELLAAEREDQGDEPAGCPDECGGCSCHLGNSAPCAHCTRNHDSGPS